MPDHCGGAFIRRPTTQQEQRFWRASTRLLPLGSGVGRLGAAAMLLAIVVSAQRAAADVPTDPQSVDAEYLSAKRWDDWQHACDYYLSVRDFLGLPLRGGSVRWPSFDGSEQQPEEGSAHAAERYCNQAVVPEADAAWKLLRYMYRLNTLVAHLRSQPLALQDLSPQSVRWTNVDAARCDAVAVHYQGGTPVILKLDGNCAALRWPPTREDLDQVDPAADRFGGVAALSGGVDLIGSLAQGTANFIKKRAKAELIWYAAQELERKLCGGSSSEEDENRQAPQPADAQNTIRALAGIFPSTCAFLRAQNVSSSGALSWQTIQDAVRLDIVNAPGNLANTTLVRNTQLKITLKVIAAMRESVDPANLSITAFDVLRDASSPWLEPEKEVDFRARVRNVDAALDLLFRLRANLPTVQALIKGLEKKKRTLQEAQKASLHLLTTLEAQKTISPHWKVATLESELNAAVNGALPEGLSTLSIDSAKPHEPHIVSTDTIETAMSELQQLVNCAPPSKCETDQRKADLARLLEHLSHFRQTYADVSEALHAVRSLRLPELKQACKKRQDTYCCGLYEGEAMEATKFAQTPVLDITSEQLEELPFRDAKLQSGYFANLARKLGNDSAERIFYPTLAFLVLVTHHPDMVRSHPLLAQTALREILLAYGVVAPGLYGGAAVSFAAVTKALDGVTNSVHLLQDPDAAPDAKQAQTRVMVTHFASLMAAVRDVVRRACACEVSDQAYLGRAADLVQAISVKDYTAVAVGLWTVIDDGKPAVSHRPSLLDALALAAQLGAAESPEQVTEALEGIATPAGTWRSKRKNLVLYKQNDNAKEEDPWLPGAGFSIMALAGPSISREWRNDGPGAWQSSGLHVSIGLDWNVFGGDWGTLGAYLPVLNLSTLTSVPFADAKSENTEGDGKLERVRYSAHAEQLVSLSLFLRHGVMRTPLVIGAGAEWFPLETRRAGATDFGIIRGTVLIGVDSTLLAF